MQPDLMFEAYQFNERSTHVKVVIYMLESDLNTLMRLEAVFAQKCLENYIGRKIETSFST